LWLQVAAAGALAAQAKPITKLQVVLEAVLLAKQA
jgi:hypothetical protein